MDTKISDVIGILLIAIFFNHDHGIKTRILRYVTAIVLCFVRLFHEKFIFSVKMPR